MKGIIMAYYQYHVFFCSSQYKNGYQHYVHSNAIEMYHYMEKRSKELGLLNSRQVMVNKTGDLSRSKAGASIVIYPENTWYSFTDQNDIDEIIEEHLVKGNIVERLLIESHNEKWRKKIRHHEELITQII